MSAARRALTAAALGAGAAGAATAAVKVVASRQRRHDDPHAQTRFDVHPTRERELASFDGGTIYVAETGPADGPAVVLCHGVTLSVRTWVFQFDALAERGMRVVAVDSRGHGRSVCGTAGHDVAHLATDLRTVLDELDLRHVVIVGHSMGGIATQAFATAYPDTVRDRVAGLVLLSTLARAPFTRLQSVVNLARNRQPGSRLFGGAIRRRDLGFLMARVALGRNAAPSLVELTREMVTACAPDTLLGAPMALAGVDLRRAIESITVPVLVICGTADLITPPAETRRIGRHIPGARVEWVEGGGHMLMLERPDVVNDLVASFAAEVAPARSASA